MLVTVASWGAARFGPVRLDADAMLAAMLVLPRAETESLLDPDDVRRAVEAAMVDVSSGRSSMPLRIAALLPERDALLAAMPAYLPATDSLAAKLVSVFPHNAASDRPTHMAVVVVFDATSGEPTALVDGTSITTARTAAGSALSAQLLARPEARVLAILGTGVQARAHASALVRVGTFSEVLVAGRDPAKARSLAAELAATLGLPVSACDSFGAACESADVICATTHSPEPVVQRQHLRPGVHVASVGLSGSGREVDSGTVADAIVVVESRQAALAPHPAGAPDLRMPIEDGLIGPDHIHAELGELVTGARPGRTRDDEITLYKSVGIAAQDVAVAAMVVAGARARGLGTELVM
jgi:ornithine cyclodeaminase